MKIYKIYISAVLVTLLTTNGWCDNLGVGNLIVNTTNGLVYHKFTNTPFSSSILPTADSPVKGAYKNGQREGQWEVFHPNGRLLSKGTYKNGQQEGRWEFFYENGYLEYESSYKKGKKMGCIKSFITLAR